MHFYAWEKGLKTGMYYLRTKAAADAIKFTVQKQTEQALTETATIAIQPQAQSQVARASDNPEICIPCGS